MEKIKIKNRSPYGVGYRIPELNIRRKFSVGEIKEIGKDELQALMYAPGGETLIRESLQVIESRVLDDLNIRVEPEYFLDEEQVKDLLVNGTIDQLLDTLDFAPASVIGLIKAYAVALPINDTQKREILKEKLHFDVDGALKIQKQIAEDEGAGTGNVTTTGKTRRTAAPTVAPQTPRYKIIQ